MSTDRDVNGWAGEFGRDSGEWPSHAEVAERLDSLAHDPGCDTRELSPSLGPSTKPCNCLGSQLRAALRRAEKAEANYQFMVERAADEKLDGYRELGARAAAAEERADEANAAEAAVRRQLAGVEARYQDALVVLRWALHRAPASEAVHAARARIRPDLEAT